MYKSIFDPFESCNSSKVQCAGPFSADTGPALLQAKKAPAFILREGGFWMHLPTYLPTYLLVVNGHVQGFGFFKKQNSFQFCDIRNLVNISPEKEKLVKFSIGEKKNSKNFPIFFG
jgi:hypothetical protein